MSFKISSKVHRSLELGLRWPRVAHLPRFADQYVDAALLVHVCTTAHHPFPGRVKRTFRLHFYYLLFGSSVDTTAVLSALELLSLPVLRCAARAAYKMAAGLHTPLSTHPSLELDSQSSDDLRKITKL
ncbi:unnamed protein product [Sphagnum jensenii]|uniref:Uncharacterized protein n=1 Tax=Sphagnum jensenii TaxID=128206 RepID=A0ABP1ALB3_9BRYO